MIPKLKTILYATGLGSGAPYVFRYALSLARQYDAKLEIVCGLAPLNVHVQRFANTYLGEKKSDEFHRQAREKIAADVRKQVEAMCRSSIIDDPEAIQFVNKIHVIEDSPDQAIMRCAKKVGADTIVMGTHRRTMAQGVMLGSCAVKVVHQSTIPVVLVRIPKGYKDLPSQSGGPEMVEF